jgi:hypothetical protein
MPPSSTTFFIFYTSQDVSCFGQSDGEILLDFPPGIFTIEWSDGDTETVITQLSGGTYTVTVTDTYGCTTSQDIIINEPSLLSIESNVSPVTCLGEDDGSAVIAISGGISSYNILWSNGAFEPAIYDLSPGFYAVEITDITGCVAYDTIEIEGPSELLSAEIQILNYYSDDSLGQATILPSGGTPPYLIDWNVPDYDGNTAFNLFPGIYQAFVVDANGCAIEVVFEITEAVLDAFETKGNGKQFSWQVRPNITAGSPVSLHIGRAANVPLALNLVSVTGQVVKSKQVRPASDKASFGFDFENVPPGIYFLTIVSEGKTLPAGKVIRF